MESSTPTNAQEAFREECLPLITFNNDTQKFDVNLEVKTMLQNLRGPIGVITVAGMYRTGKSYLLNRMLLNRQRGFGVGPSINPCTKGLWVWGTPISGFTPEGQPINVLVVDSEGIGGLDEDNNHDMRIFSLALLLSSYFIYNSTGSIDENAMNNLSLVINLTKHIQFKTRQSEDQEVDDSEDLAEYFPSFMWVVRDFALQLVDENHNEISSKEYLERALQEKGGSADQKNEIRKHLKKYFKDRECCTMIRPLTNEDELQNLETMDLDELRAEFVEQVMHLRRKVINKIKPKMINNQTMDGITWISLVEQYVNAINEGAVPNIQSSWIYICKQRASEGLDTCKEAFETEIEQTVQFPTNAQDLDQTLKELEEDISKKFSKLVKGDQEIVSEYQRELEDYLRTRSNELRNTNNMECKKFATDLINQLFTEFDQQIKQQGLSFDPSSIDMTLKELHNYYEQNAFDFSEKDLMIAEAKAAFLFDTLYFFSKSFESEISTQRQLDSQFKDSLEQQLKEAKEESKLERIKVEDRLRQTLLEKAEIEASHQFLKEQYECLKVTKDQDEQELKDQLAKIKEESTTDIDSLKSQKEEFEEQLQTLQRKLVQAESEFDKERALFDQKVEFLEKTLQDKTTKERDFMSEWQNQKSEMSGELRSINAKYEYELKQLTHQLEEEKERATELESTLRDKVALLEEKDTKWMEMEAQYKQMIQLAQDQQKQMELAVSAVKRENEKQLSISVREKEDKSGQHQQQVQELEQQLRDITEQLKAKDHEMKKECALKDQKFQFVEMQLTECRHQLEEAYRQHESMVKAMKTENSPRRNQQDDVNELEALQAELSKITEELEDNQRQFKNSSDSYQERITELELQLKLLHGDYDRDVKELRTQITEIESTRLGLQEKVKQLEVQKVRLVEEADLKFKDAETRFEDELEAKEQTVQQELKEMQDKSEEALAQLKNFYEIEKEKLEQRIAEERDRGNRRINHYQEELEQRIREEVSEKEDEIECLQNELRELEQNHQGYVIQMEHELSLKVQMVETLERQVKESRERIEAMECGRNSAFEKQIEHFEQQRQEYNQKIDRLQLENLEKDRQIAQLQHKLERITEELERKKSDFEGYKTTFEKEKRQLTEKLESTKKKLTDSQDEAMQAKLEYGRDQALSNQQNEFLNKKIEELQRSQEENQRFFDDKIKSYKSEIQDEAQAQIERISSEKELWENKYEQKRRALKEIEQSLTRTNTDLEKKVNILTTQVERLEDEKRQLDEHYQDEIMNLQSQIQALDSSAGAAYYYGSAHAEDVLKLKSQVQDLERELSDLQSTYDRDKALWEGKCQFLEGQKETYKRDLIESQKKFEITLEQLQKRGSLDKDKFESNQQALIKVIESKYKNQIKEMLETHQCLQNEGSNKVRRLENELKILNEKLQMEARGKLSEHGSLEKKVQELLENERRLSAELDELKMEREKRNQDLQRQQDKEKEAYRYKLNEYESKAKEAENRRATLMFEFEKERAKWQLEKDSLVGQKSEMYEQIERLQIKKDQLLRENEKLRNENKGSRKYLFQNSSNMPTQPSSSSSVSQSASATRYMLGKSISGVGSHVLNQAINKMKENQTNKYIGGGDDSTNVTPLPKHNRYGH